MFQTARWRLTLSFVATLGAILIATGIATYAVTSAVVYDQVDRELKGRGDTEQLVIRPQFSGRDPRPPRGDVHVGPQFTSGGHFYALVATDGDLLAATPNLDPAALAPAEVLAEASQKGYTFVNVLSSEGETLRLYVTHLGTFAGTSILLQVGRSIEPERQALQRLQTVLAGGVLGGLGLAFVGGYFLSARALKPIRLAVEAQHTFVADASHELRTPLAIIRANAEMLERHPERPIGAHRDTVADIINETDRLARLVDQMLTLAQADANQAELAVTDVDLDDLTEDVSRGMRLLAMDRGVTIETEKEPLRLRADPDRLRELLTILLENGVKYTDTGGRVRLEIHRAAPDVARIRVTDTGRGIPAESLPRIFDRFYRVDKSRSRALGGAGLGLAIAKWIVEAHGGTIHVESTLGVGTTFTVDLPVGGPSRASPVA